LKEIGEKLKETREEIGISLEEASEDLKIEVKQLEDIENGNTEAFSDVFNLKYFIRDYAKYLGLDKEELIDEFNEYLFDYTSKLSLDDIKKDLKEKEDKNKIKSPYTVERKNEKVFKYVAFASMILLLIIICYLLYAIFIKPDDKPEDNLVYGGINYEFTK